MEKEVRMNALFNTAKTAIMTAVLLAMALPLIVNAQQQQQQPQQQPQPQQERQQQQQQQRDQARPMEEVGKAADVLQKMRTDADMRQLLDEAKGVFLIPDYAAAALVIGGAGGEGVLLTREDDEWRNPAFYNVGSISAGLQAGVAVGPIALVLLTDKVLNNFKDENNFSLTADAGYAIIDWSARARGELGEGNDVVVWTDTEGLFGELAVGITDVNWDRERNQEYYGQQVSATQVLGGEVQNPHEQMLQQALREQQ
jgi:SH3 domain-containing YSC84-like protein 1